MSTQPVNCGTSFCSCIECVVPLRTMTREELDTEIVVAISVFKAAKREELVKAVENAKDTYNAFWDVKDAGAAAWDAYIAAKKALKSYDKEKNT